MSESSVFVRATVKEAECRPNGSTSTKPTDVAIKARVNPKKSNFEIPTQCKTKQV